MTPAFVSIRSRTFAGAREREAHDRAARRRRGDGETPVSVVS